MASYRIKSGRRRLSIERGGGTLADPLNLEWAVEVTPCGEWFDQASEQMEPGPHVLAHLIDTENRSWIHLDTGRWLRWHSRYYGAVPRPMAMRCI